MTTTIYKMDEKTGKIDRQATYTVPGKQAIINYIMQYIKHNFNTWQYPQDINGIRESDSRKHTYYYDDIPNNSIIMAYEEA
jgi:hypothetical protein